MTPIWSPEAIAEPQNFGYREGPARFGLFDWLCR